MNEAKQNYGMNRRLADGLFVLSVVLFVLIAGWVIFQYVAQGGFNALLLLLALIPVAVIGMVRRNLRRP